MLLQLGGALYAVYQWYPGKGRSGEWDDLISGVLSGFLHWVAFGRGILAGVVVHNKSEDGLQDDGEKEFLFG